MGSITGRRVNVMGDHDDGDIVAEVHQLDEVIHLPCGDGVQAGDRLVQQQRVLLARALCATKKLLLLDEPVTGLDPIATGELYNLIKLVNLCDGITVIMVSHDIHAAVRYATHILHLGHTQLFFGTSAAYKESSLARRFLGGNGI